MPVAHDFSAVGGAFLVREQDMQMQEFKHCVAATLIAVALSISVPVRAQSGIEVSNAWARATVAAQKAGGVYLDIRSAAPARLVKASTPVAARAEIHNMSMENGVMKMFAVDGIDIAAGQTIKLAPGGYHVMLLDLKQQLKAGDGVPMTLTVERADKSRVTVEVRAEVRDMAGGVAHKMH
jgi:copper(I)-binding protein